MIKKRLRWIWKRRHLWEVIENFQRDAKRFYTNFYILLIRNCYYWFKNLTADENSWENKRTWWNNHYNWDPSKKSTETWNQTYKATIGGFWKFEHCIIKEQTQDIISGTLYISKFRSLLNIKEKSTYLEKFDLCISFNSWLRYKLICTQLNAKQ